MDRNAESRGIRFGGSPVGVIVILSRETVTSMLLIYPRASRGSLQALTAAVMSIHVKVFTVPAGLTIGGKSSAVIVGTWTRMD